MHRTAGPSAPAVVRIREAGEADEARIVDIGNALFPNYPETLEELRHYRARLRAGGYATVLAVAETPGGEVVGYSNYHHMPGQFDPGRYRVGVYVGLAWQRRGVGTVLFDHMLAALTARDAKAIESFARETMPEVIGFLTRRGFRETLRTWELRLDLGRFDPAPFARLADRVRQTGVVIATLDQESARDHGALRRVYELHNAVVADIPAPIPFTPVSFEDYVHSNVESPRALLGGYFLARVGEAYVGEANLRRPQEGTHLYHNVTGVLPAYRGRGIAMALKLATIAYGRAHDHSEIRTWNEVRNAGMLAINERLGFVRQPAWITFEKALGAIGGV